jgi:Putative zinc-finger
MAGEHPTELTLHAYVEGELEGAERASVEAHLTACESCAADVALVRQGREAMRAAPPLELPAETRERILGALPVRQEARPVTGRRWLAIAAPVAAALALAGGIATVVVVAPSGNDEGGGGGQGAAVADEAAGDTAGKESAGGGAERATTGALELFKSVEGNPRELARELRQRGFDARVENGTVVVRTAKVAKLERLLGDYPRDAVRVEP